MIRACSAPEMLELHREHLNYVAISRQQNDGILADIPEVPVEENFGASVTICQEYEVDLGLPMVDQPVLVVWPVGAGARSFEPRDVAKSRHGHGVADVLPPQVPSRPHGYLTRKLGVACRLVQFFCRSLHLVTHVQRRVPHLLENRKPTDYICDRGFWRADFRDMKIVLHGVVDAI